MFVRICRGFAAQRESRVEENICGDGGWSLPILEALSPPQVAALPGVPRRTNTKVSSLARLDAGGVSRAGFGRARVCV